MEQAIGSGIQVNFSEYLSQFEPNEFTIEKTVKVIKAMQIHLSFHFFSFKFRHRGSIEVNFDRRK